MADSTIYAGRPAFIPQSSFREWMKPRWLDDHFTVDGILPSSYIARCAKNGAPLRGRAGMFRPIDIVARARANFLTVGESHERILKSSLYELECELAALRATVAAEKKKHELSVISYKLTGEIMLSADEIVSAAADPLGLSGVYFLIHLGIIKYVGQSVNVFSRLSAHMASKDVHHFAYIPCPQKKLDALESLYIHMLTPEWNGGNTQRSGKHAPLKMVDLLASI